MISHRKLYVGIDIHKREHTVAVIPVALLTQTGEVWKQSITLTIRNNIADFERLNIMINSHISSVEEVVIAVDHTGGHYSEPLIYFLQRKGYTVYHLETKATKAARERFLDKENKSDVIDATSAAYLLYLRDVHGMSFRISVVRSELGSKAAVMRSLILQRQQFVKLATQVTNRLHQFLLAVFPEGEEKYFKKLLDIVVYYPTPEDIIASNGLEAIPHLRQADRESLLILATESVGVPGDLYRQLIKDLCMQRAEAKAKCEAIAYNLQEEVQKHPYGQILLSFPYLSYISAATIIGVINDIDRWPDKKKFRKAFGVYAKFKQSGGSPGHGRQGKEGSKDGRRTLFQVCFGCISRKAPENDFKDYYKRQVERGKPKMKALVSTMGKLAEIIYHCLKADEPYCYQGKYKQSTVRHVGIKTVS